MIPLLPCAALALLPQDPAPRLVREELSRGFVAEVTVVEDEKGLHVRHGSLVVLDAGGNRRVHGEYEMGQRSGRWRFLRPGGEVLAAGRYVDGRRSGTWSFDRADGKRWFKGKFKDGFPSGRWTAWGPDGEADALHTGRYEALVDVELGAGQRGTGLLLDGELHGRWTTTWPNGRPQLEATYARGRRTGRWDLWHVDGTHDPGFLEREPSELAGATPWCRAILEDPVPVEVPLPMPGPKEPGETPDPRAIAECLEAEGIDPGVEKEFEIWADPGREWKGFVPKVEALPALRDPFWRLALRELTKAEFEAEPLSPKTLRLLQIGGAVQDGHFVLWGDKSRHNQDFTWRRAALRLHALHALTERVETWWPVESRLTTIMALDDEPGGIFSMHLETLGDQEKVPDLYESRFARRDPLERPARTALDKALAWLVKHQDDDGKWDCDEFMKHCPPTDTHRGPGKAWNDVGVTGLALLALLGDGNTLLDGPYQENVQRGVLWLFEQQDFANGLLGEKAVTSFVYDHAIATLALVEAYHTSGLRGIRRHARKAVAYIHKARNKKGVWRYEVPPVGANDSSVTSWMLQALVAAREAGFAVDPACFDDAATWFDEITDRVSGRGGYRRVGEGSARVPGVNDHYSPAHSAAMTAVALYSSTILGSERDDKLQLKRAALILKRLPDVSVETSPQWDHYFWYHATYGMQGMDRKQAKAWRTAVVEALLETQEEDGDWDPDGAWGYAGGRVYTTALGALMLLAPKRHARAPRAR